MRHFRLILLASLLVSSGAILAQTDTIAWRDDVKITWDDFKGRASSSSPYYANTDYMINFGYNYSDNDAKIHVGCYFDRHKSWVIKSKERDSLLMHEKTHFAIAEIFARKARKILMDTVMHQSDINNIVTYVNRKTMQDCKQYQDQYDNETQHSIITAKQIEWMKKVYEELDALKAYSNTEIQKTLQ
jgi:hypothetical protein